MMANKTRAGAHLCPTTIAIHDNGDMGRIASAHPRIPFLLCLDLHNLGLLALKRRVNFGDKTIGQLLNFGLPEFLVILTQAR